MTMRENGRAKSRSLSGYFTQIKSIFKKLLRKAENSDLLVVLSAVNLRGFPSSFLEYSKRKGKSSFQFSILWLTC